MSTEVFEALLESPPYGHPDSLQANPAPPPDPNPSPPPISSSTLLPGASGEKSATPSSPPPGCRDTSEYDRVVRTLRGAQQYPGWVGQKLGAMEVLQQFQVQMPHLGLQSIWDIVSDIAVRGQEDPAYRFLKIHPPTQSGAAPFLEILPAA